MIQAMLKNEYYHVSGLLCPLTVPYILSETYLNMIKREWLCPSHAASYNRLSLINVSLLSGVHCNTIFAIKMCVSEIEYVCSYVERLC